MPNENNNSSELDDLFSSSDMSSASSNPFADQDESVELSVDPVDSTSAADPFDATSFGLDASPDQADAFSSATNSFADGASAFGAPDAFGASSESSDAPVEDAKGKKGKKAKKEKKAKPAKASAKKDKPAKKEKAPKVKSEYVSSPAPVFLFGAILLAFIGVVNAVAYSIGGSASFVFLGIFDALGLVMLLVPGMLLKLLRQRRIELFDMFLALGAVLSVASVMVLFAYWAKTYSGTTKVALASPAAAVLQDSATDAFFDETQLA